MDTVAQPTGNRINQTPAEEIKFRLEQQRIAFLADPVPSLRTRQDRLSRGIAMLGANRDRIIDAINADFGQRAKALSLIADVLHPMMAMKHARKNVGRWMRPEWRTPQFPTGLLGLSAWVEFQALGVIGVVSPWNAPVSLCMTPLAGILAAGNRAMIKPSELAVNTAGLVAEMVANTFDPAEVTVVQGGLETAKAFIAQPFDHLLYTGGGAVARYVMDAAAKHLTPVTLELGGKSPVIIADDADLADAASKIMSGKLSNAGQVCMCPDHAWVPRDKVKQFAVAAEVVARRMFPTIEGNKEYTSVFGNRNQARLAASLKEVYDAGATVIQAGGSTDPSLIPPTLVIDPPENSMLVRDEIFGPILVIRSYQDLNEVITYLNSRPVPLAMYFFGHRKAEISKMVSTVRCGGVTVNDVMLHPFMQNLPFGGLGESGMGRYIGLDGFKTFSHQKAVVSRGWFDISAYIQPPYSRRMIKLLNFATRP